MQDALSTLPHAHKRQLLKEQLTTLPFDPSPQLSQKIEKILLHELYSNTAHIVPLSSLVPVESATTAPAITPRVYVWRGDITTLQVDAIVNAANQYMLGYVKGEGKWEEGEQGGRGERERRSSSRLLASSSFFVRCFSPNHPCIDNAIHCKAGPGRRRGERRRVDNKKN